MSGRVKRNTAVEKQTYVRENLGDGISVFVSPAHTFGTDALALAEFAHPKAGENACDMGTGCGIIPLVWCKHEAPKTVVGIDIQPACIDLCKLSIEKSGLSRRFWAVCADLRHIKNYFPGGSFDLVTMNPPYTAEGAGRQSADPAKRTARSEAACTLSDITNAASFLLRFGGRLCLCHRPERLCEVLDAMRSVKIEPKRLRFVHARPDSAPSLFLVEGKRGANPGLAVEKPYFPEARS